MLASRNQMNVMSRGFGGTHNGSMPAYGAVGEMETYLSGMRHAPMKHSQESMTDQKPNFSPQTKGEVMDSQEISTANGWSVVYVVKNSAGYYVVEHYCPKANSHLVDGKYPTLAEAKETANKIAFQLRNTGKVTGWVNGLGGYSSFGAPTIGLQELAIGSALVLYIGADAPGARPVLKQIKKTFNEPKSAIQNFMMITGALGLGFSILLGTGELNRLLRWYDEKQILWSKFLR